MAILVVGSVALDTIQTPFERRRDVLGGSATYFSLAARFFNPVRVVAVIGNDMPGDKLSCLKRRNIDLKGLEVKNGKTFRWQGKYDFDFNKRTTIKLELNVFQDFVPRIPLSYRDSKYVLLANIDPRLQRNVLEQVKSNAWIALDTIDHWINNKRNELLKLMKKVDTLFINDSEARLFSQYSNLRLAAAWLKQKGPSVIVIKKGEHGVFMLAKNKFFSCPGYPLKTVVDPTGAGDAFAGGFMGYLAHVKRFNDTALRQAVIYGSSLGSFTVEEFGPNRLAGLNRSKIIERVNAFKQLTYFRASAV